MDVEFGSDLGEIEEVEIIVGYAGRLFRPFYSWERAEINPRTAMTTGQLRFALRVFQFKDNDAVPSRCFYLVRKFAHLLCLFNIYYFSQK